MSLNRLPPDILAAVEAHLEDASNRVHLRMTSHRVAAGLGDNVSVGTEKLYSMLAHSLAHPHLAVQVVCGKTYGPFNKAGYRPAPVVKFKPSSTSPHFQVNVTTSSGAEHGSQMFTYTTRISATLEEAVAVVKEQLNCIIKSVSFVPAADPPPLPPRGGPPLWAKHLYNAHRFGW